MEEQKVESKKRLPSEVMVWFWVFIFGIGSFIVYQFFFQPISQLIEEESLTPSSIGIEIGNLAPDFTLEDSYGTKFSLSDFNGKKPVLLIFWATWCSFCAEELEGLKVFTEKYKNEIEVIAVTAGESEETVKNYIEEKNINFPVLLGGDRAVWDLYSVRGTPSHFLITISGEIVTKRPGSASREDLEVMITML